MVLKQNIGGLLDGSGEPNFPNPVTAATLFKTTIPFSTNHPGEAHLTVSDDAGKTVYQETENVEWAGKHYFYLTATDLPTGRYYYHIEFPKGYVIVEHSMIIVK